jgi:hypothetical protein
MINSFNDWPKGTAIEPVKETEAYELSDSIWCGKDSNFFVAKTKEWIKKFRGQ